MKDERGSNPPESESEPSVDERPNRADSTFTIDLDRWAERNQKRWSVPLFRVRGVKVAEILVQNERIANAKWRFERGAVYWEADSPLPREATAALDLDPGWRIKALPAGIVTALIAAATALTTTYINKDCDRCVAPLVKVADESGCKGETVQQCLEGMRRTKTELQRKVADLANAKEAAESLAEALQNGNAEGK